MKRLVVALLCVLPVCAFGGHWSSFPGRFDCPDITSSFRCARSIEASLHSTFVVRRDENVVDVVLRNGTHRSFTDQRTPHDAGDGEIRYSVVELTSSGRYAVIQRQFNEGGAFALLDRFDGSYRELQGYPVFSPDERHVVVAESDVAAGYDSNVLQILRLEHGKWILEYDASGERWGPINVRWLSSGSLSYEKATFPCAEEHVAPCEPFRLTLDRHGWEVTPDRN